MPAARSDVVFLSVVRTSIVIALTLLVAAPAASQEGTRRTRVSAAEQVWVELADFTFHPGSFDPIRYFLQRGVIYRVQFSEPNIVLEMRSYEGKQVPFVRYVNSGPDATGRTDFELSPNDDGEIEFRQVGGVSGTATRFQLWRIEQRTATTPMEPVTEAAGLEVGVIGRLGAHGAYIDREFTYADNGGVVEACVAFRGGSGVFDRLGGCVFGLSYEMGGARSKLTFAFIEPRLRILGPILRPGPTVNGGVVVRFASRISSGTGDPFLDPAGDYELGAGLYVALNYRRAGRGGTQLETSILIQQVGSRIGPSTGTPTAASSSGANAPAFRIGVGQFF